MDKKEDPFDSTKVNTVTEIDIFKNIRLASI